MKHDTILLFYEYELDLVLQAQSKKIKELASAVPSATLIEESIEELVPGIEEEVRVEPLELIENETTVDQTETKVDVSHDFGRAIFDRSQPFFVDGLRVSYYVPFKGDKQLFQCKPNSFTFNPPRARISEHELVLDYDRADRDIVATKEAFKQDLDNVRQWVEWVRQQVDDFNSGLASKIQQELSARQQHLKASQQQIGDLGFKVRPKTTTPTVPESAPQPAQSATATRRRKTRTTVPPRYDVALSFAGEDRDYVEKVATALRDSGIKVFYDKFEDVDLWGKNLADHLGTVYANSQFVVIFVSKHYAEKAWPNHERKHAQARALKDQVDIILPARFDETRIPGLPETVAYINLRKTTPEELADKIIRKLK